MPSVVLVVLGSLGLEIDTRTACRYPPAPQLLAAFLVTQRQKMICGKEPGIFNYFIFILQF